MELDMRMRAIRWICPNNLTITTQYEEHEVKRLIAFGEEVEQSIQSELADLRNKLDYYEVNIESRRKLGDASSMGCLYCKYEQGQPKKPCFPHFELARLREYIRNVEAERDQIKDDLK